MMAQALIDLRLPGDETVFHALNGMQVGWVDALFSTATSWQFGLAAAVSVAVWLAVVLGRGAVRPLLQALIASGLTDVIGHRVLKPWVGRARPCFSLPQGTFRQLAEVSNVGSMPSLHAANAFAFAVAVSLLWPRASRVLLPLAVIIALSRVVVGVHWPSDVLAGMLFGSATAYAVHLSGERLQLLRRDASAREAETDTEP